MRVGGDILSESSNQRRTVESPTKDMDLYLMVQRWEGREGHVPITRGPMHSGKVNRGRQSCQRVGCSMSSG